MPAMKGQKYTGFIFTYEVEGMYGFPMDMLRYDQAWPASGEDAAKIDKGHMHPIAHDRLVVRLKGLSLPTVARWESFGWKVLPEGLR